MEIDNNFYTNLKHLREKNGLSQQELADKIGVDRSTIGYWENKKAEPSMFNVCKIAEVLNVDLSSLILKDLRSDNSTLANSPTEQEDMELLRSTLKRKGFLNENEEMTKEDFDKLMEFAKANKQFIMKDNEKRK